MGQYEARFTGLSDDELLAGLSSVVGRRNQITAEFLAYLAELDERQLFLERGYSSLFEYCVEALGLCESTAGRHIAAARVCRNHPQAFAMMASGVLHASALSLMRKHLTPENADELFELCHRQSARKVEELLAARFPRPDVRDLVRRLPARSELTPDAGRWRPTNVQASLSERSDQNERLAATSEGAVELAQGIVDSPSRGPLVAARTSDAAEPPKRRRLEPLSADRYGVHFTADGEFRDLLERVRGLAGHRLPSGDLMTLIKCGLEAYERELEKERFALGRKPRGTRRGVVSAEGARSTKLRADSSGAQESSVEKPGDARSVGSVVAFEPAPNPSSQKRKRQYSAAVLREVYVRDGKRCSYVAPDGRRCGARRRLELDHIDPCAVGGRDTALNLRLRCRAHNQWYARAYFGRAYVDAKVRRLRAAKAGC